MTRQFRRRRGDERYQRFDPRRLDVDIHKARKRLLRRRRLRRIDRLVARYRNSEECLARSRDHETQHRRRVCLQQHGPMAEAIGLI